MPLCRRQGSNLVRGRQRAQFAALVPAQEQRPKWLQQILPTRARTPGATSDQTHAPMIPRECFQQQTGFTVWPRVQYIGWLQGYALHLSPLHCFFETRTSAVTFHYRTSPGSLSPRYEEILSVQITARAALWHVGQSVSMPAPLFADDNVLLALAFDPDHRANAQYAGLTFEFFDFDRQGIRHFLMQARHQLLADQLGSQESFTAVGDLVFIEKWPGKWQLLQDHFLQVRDTLSPFFAEINATCSENGWCHFRLQKCQQPRLVCNTIHLVYHQDQRNGGIPDHLGCMLVLLRPAICLDQEQHHVDVVKRRSSDAIHVAVERAPGCEVDARSVEIHDLPLGGRLDAGQALSRGLRFGRDNAQFLADEPVHKRRFSDIWAANQGNIAATVV